MSFGHKPYLVIFSRHYFITKNLNIEHDKQENYVLQQTCLKNWCYSWFSTVTDARIICKIFILLLKTFVE